MPFAKKYKKEDIDQLRAFLELKKPLPEIAAFYGISMDALAMLMSRNKLYVKDGKRGRPRKLISNREKVLSIAERLAILQGLQAAPEEERKFVFTDEELKCWIDNPERFLKELLSVNLYDYQREMLGLLQNNRRVLFCCGRGIGKSFVIALFLVYKAIIKPNQKCLVIAPTDRQARILLEYVHSHIANCDGLFKSVDFKKTNQERITFTNGSWVAPLGSTSFLRGFQNIDLLILDEAAYLENADKLWASILPMIKSETGQFVVSSTPSVVGDKFHQAYLSPSFRQFKVPSILCPRYTQEDLRQMEQDLSPYEYQTEVLAEFCEGIDNFFSPELIQRCSQRYDFSQFPEDNAIIFIGIDWGRFRDASVITIFQKQDDGVLKMVYARELTNTEFSKQVFIIKELCKRWNPTTVIAEENGLSIHACEQLKEAGLPVTAFKPTIETKQEAFTHLLRLMEQGKIVLPMIPRLQHQFRNFRYEVTTSGKLKLHHSTEIVGDDWPDSVAFAISASKEKSKIKFDVWGFGSFRR